MTCRWRAALGRGLCAAAATGLAGAATAQDRKWSDIVDAARKEGTVVFYSGAVTNKCVDAIVRDFKRKFGIEVQSLKARGGELFERIRVEQAANRFIADVEWSGPSPIHLQGRDGALEPLGPLPNLANLAPGVAADRFSVPVFVNHVGVLINDQLVKPGDVKSWKSLGDPKWRGKLVSDNVDIPSSANIWFDVTRAALGVPMHEAIAANKPFMTRDFGASQRRIAAGEFAMHINHVATDAFAAKGLPVRWVVPDEGAPFFYARVAVLKHAPHPNAARVFVDHLLDMGSQVSCAHEGMGPVIQGAIDKVDPAVRHFIDVKKLGEQSAQPAVVNRAIEDAKKVYPK